MTPHRLLIVLGALTGALLLATPLAAHLAALPAGNLVQNPGGEAGPGATTTRESIPPAPWETTGGFSAVAYNDKLGFPGAAFSTTVGGGKNFFTGGPDSQVATATQVVDVATASAEIDAGKAAVRLSALLGGYAAQADAARIDIAFLGASGSVLAGGLRIGPVTVADRGGETKLLPRSATGAVPAGTRQLRIRITSTRSTGPYNDGYSDNVSVQLVAGGTTTTPTPAKPSSTTTLTLRCAAGRVYATVTPPAAKRVAEVFFKVNGKVIHRDRTKPYTDSFSTKGAPATIPVTAQVEFVGSANGAVVTKKVRKC